MKLNEENRKEEKKMMLNKSKLLGFTLIEILVAIAIVAVIASIAYPTYRNYQLKARRSEARNVLIKLIADAEQFRAQNNRYPTPSEVPNPNPAFYSIVGFNCADYSWITNSNTDCITFEANARTAPQINDTPCLRFALDSDGNRYPANSECWPR